MGVDVPWVPLGWLLVFLCSVWRKGWRLVGLGMFLAAVLGLILIAIAVLLHPGVAPAG